MAVKSNGQEKAKATAYALVTVLILSLTIWATIEASKPFPGPPTFGVGSERLAIKEVAVNPTRTSLTITVIGIQGMDGRQNMTINRAIVKNSTGFAIQTISLENNPLVVPADNNTTTIHIDLAPLQSNEQYTVTITTTSGSAFVSPIFTT